MLGRVRAARPGGSLLPHLGVNTRTDEAPMKEQRRADGPRNEDCLWLKIRTCTLPELWCLRPMAVLAAVTDVAPRLALRAILDRRRAWPRMGGHAVEEVVDQASNQVPCSSPRNPYPTAEMTHTKAAW